MVMEAANNGADIIMLPEIWMTAYNQEYVSKDAEDLSSGESVTFKVL